MFFSPIRMNIFSQIRMNIFSQIRMNVYLEKNAQECARILSNNEQ